MKPKNLLTLAFSVAAVSAATTTFAATPVGEAEYQFVLDPGQTFGGVPITSADFGGTFFFTSEPGDSPDGVSELDLSKSTLTMEDNLTAVPFTIALSDVIGLQQYPNPTIEDTIWNSTTISQMALAGLTGAAHDNTEFIVTDSSINVTGGDPSGNIDPTGHWVRIVTTPEPAMMTLMTLGAGSLAVWGRRTRKK